MGLVSLGTKVTFLGTKKKLSKADCLIFCPDPRVEHFCLPFGSKNKSTERKMSTLPFILLIDVLTTETSCCDLLFSIPYFYRTLGSGEGTEHPISWCHCVSRSFLCYIPNHVILAF